MPRRPATDPRRAVAYLRVSTDEQHLGPDAQRAAIAAWAAREGVEVAAWHVDQGVSGAADLTDRPALAAALGELRALSAGLLLVAKRDRLARDVAVAALLDRAVAGAGARVVAADGVANGDSPADAFMRTILDGAAAYERALIRSRTRAALAAKRARGERAGTVPYGFTADAAGRLSVCPEEQAVLSQIRELRAAGLTLREIRDELARLGLCTRAQTPFDLARLSRLLRAPVSV